MRIKYSLLPKLRNLTNREMDFFLYIARYQDRRGFVVGVHNKAVCRATGMCKQSFYTSMRGLAEKGVITYDRNDNDYDIMILGNDFAYENAWKEGYINLQRKVFHQKKFQTLKANEKYLLMELLKRTNESSKTSFHIYTKNFYRKLTELLGVTKRVIRSYLHSLRRFFSVGIRDGQYYITYLHSVFGPKEETMRIDNQDYEHFVKVHCRRKRIEYTDQELHDTAWLLKEYRDRYKDVDLSLQELREMLAEAIGRSVEQKASSMRRLNAKYVHKLLREILFPAPTVSVPEI